jgi:Winged helix-turn-helix DNA-binding
MTRASVALVVSPADTKTTVGKGGRKRREAVPVGWYSEEKAQRWRGAIAWQKDMAREFSAEPLVRCVGLALRIEFAWNPTKISDAELAARSGITIKRLQSALTRLEDAGLIQRSRSNGQRLIAAAYPSGQFVLTRHPSYKGATHTPQTRGVGHPSYKGYIDIEPRANPQLIDVSAKLESSGSIAERAADDLEVLP